MSTCTLVTKAAPDFTADAVMADNSFGQVTLSSYQGKYVYLLFYPLDFTFVCPSEILAFNKKLDEFKSRNCEVIAVSVDSKFTHLADAAVLNLGVLPGQVQFPMVADLNKEITKAYGIEHPASVALRGLFLVDPKGTVRHCVINDLPLGRSVDEALRMLDALQFTDTHGEVCPANWKQGDEAMKPTAEGVASYLAKHGK